MNQHTERRLENHALLNVFEMEQMIEEQMKKHIMSCFHKDFYIGLKDPRIGYTNITTTRLFEYLYDEYGEKTEKLQNKALADMEEEVDLTGLSINSLPPQAKEAASIPFGYITSCPRWTVHYDIPTCH